MKTDNLNKEKEIVPGCLYLCATPIGNLEDLTLRALRILKEADLIAAEDTRHTRKLLSFYDIHTPLTSYYEHNERDKAQQLINEIKKGKSIALVSDAGTPGISDPGHRLVVLAIQEELKVIPVPGASAVIAAVTSSGLSTERFAFEGFLPRGKKERDQIINQIPSEERTLVFYESPHRVVKTLQDILNVAGDRSVAVAKELTKLHEQVIRGKISVVLEHFQNNKPRGEFAIVLEGCKQTPKELPNRSSAEIYQLVFNLISIGVDKKTAIREIAKSTGLGKREVYNAVLLGEDKR